MRVLASGLQFPEGPIALDDGSVLVVEIEGGTLARVLPDGAVERIAACGGGPNGAAIGPDGAVYVANDGGLAFETIEGIRQPTALAAGHDGGSLQRVDLTTGAVETVFTHCEGERIMSGNDIVFDRAGGFYVNDTVAGAVYYGQPDGSAIHIAASGLTTPNGLGLSPDGRRLFGSETYTGRIVAWDVLGPGRLSSSATEVYSTHGEHDWDGLAIDADGNVCAANLQASGITTVSPAGTVVDRATVPDHDPFVTNICFGGHDLRTAYICSSGLGRLYVTRWPRAGLALNFTR